MKINEKHVPPGPKCYIKTHKRKKKLTAKKVKDLIIVYYYYFYYSFLTG